MGLKTGRITYNLANRMRKHRGQDRNFDLAAAARIMNSPAVQERIKQGDMVGYFGHWPRVRFGIDPEEGGFVDGRQVSLEPCSRTIYLRAHDNGLVEHEQEILDTESGKIAQRIWGSNAYGFSSAIDTKRLGNVQVPIGFFGFDFVKEPNYAENRGYAVALDGVFDSEDILDAVEERNQLFMSVNAVLDSARRDYDNALATINSLMAEREELFSMLKRRDQRVHEPVLDGVLEVLHVPRRTYLDDADDFLDAPLIHVEKEPVPPSPTQAADKLLKRHFR